jgi:hypothetical protein
MQGTRNYSFRVSMFQEAKTFLPVNMHNASFKPGLSRLAEESTGTAYGSSLLYGSAAGHMVPEMDNGMQKSRPAVSDAAFKQAY